MERQCRRNIQQALRWAEKTLAFAERAEGQSYDDGCRLLYGIMRDSAYQIRAEALREMKRHPVRPGY